MVETNGLTCAVEWKCGARFAAGTLKVCIEAGRWPAQRGGSHVRNGYMPPPAEYARGRPMRGRDHSRLRRRASCSALAVLGEGGTTSSRAPARELELCFAIVPEPAERSKAEKLSNALFVGAKVTVFWTGVARDGCCKIDRSGSVWSRRTGLARMSFKSRHDSCSEIATAKPLSSAYDELSPQEIARLKESHEESERLP